MTMNICTLLSASALAALAVSVAASPVQSQGQAQAQPQAIESGSDDIIVTATKRATNLHDIPFSINAQTAEDLRRSGATNIGDVSRSVAGLTV